MQETTQRKIIVVGRRALCTRSRLCQTACGLSDPQVPTQTPCVCGLVCVFQLVLELQGFFFFLLNIEKFPNKRTGGDCREFLSSQRRNLM